MAYEAVDCVDAGTEYCPCYLAETNNCLICSQLQGKVFCDCINWKGVCIYQEYVWNGSKRKDIRDNAEAKILKKEMINDKIMLLRLKVTRTHARELNQPGSYIFIRNENYPEFFDVPMSVMYSDEMNEIIDLLVQIRGVKTRALLNTEESLNIRGPYWNGIMGLRNLKITRDKNCLIIARGIAQAPAVLVAKKLRFSNNEVFVLLDPGSACTTISKDYFENLGCQVMAINLLDGKQFNADAYALIKKEIEDKNISFIFSGGSDIIHRNIVQLKNIFPANLLFTCTNNANICCGEGICGSCILRLRDGRKIKSCKAQMDPTEYLGGINK